MSLARIVVREDPFDMAFAFVLGLVALLQRLVFMWPQKEREREREEKRQQLATTRQILSKKKEAKVARTTTWPER
jgi:hypothetical protein